MTTSPARTLLLAVASVAAHKRPGRHLACIEHAALYGALGFAASQNVKERGFPTARGPKQGSEGAWLQKAADVLEQGDDLAAPQCAFVEVVADILQDPS